MEPLRFDTDGEPLELEASLSISSLSYPIGGELCVAVSPTHVDTGMEEGAAMTLVGSDIDVGKVAERCANGRGDASPRIEGRRNRDGGALVEELALEFWGCLGNPGLRGGSSSSESSPWSKIRLN